MIEIYVDGSFHIHREVAGWGFVVIDENGENIYEDCGSTPEKALSRQIDGELHATKKALEWAKENGYKEIKVIFDYIGISHWFLNEWKAKKPVAINFVQFAEAYKKENKDIKIEWKHVYGHSGNKWNDYADRLADRGKYL